MSKAYVVVGLGFGDEGKGLCTDWLARSVEKPLVIRFNGGHQAGHTVVTTRGERHVFSNLGSGTFRGVPTYWSRFCTFSPPSFIKEFEALAKLEIAPSVYVDNLCPVTTHYDILFNRGQEKARKEKPHGSCGVGFGATIERHSSPYKLYAQDLLFPKVCSLKLKSIRNFYLSKSMINGLDEHDHDEADRKFLKDLERLEEFRQSEFIRFVNEHSVFSNQASWNNYIFEGAQGILLDMDYGFFPHVTRSNTTSQNAITLIKENLISKIDGTEIFYVSRCYQTRHGAGPLTNEDHKLSLINNQNETNVTHEYQGSFRTSPLDIDMMQYALRCDENFSSSCDKNILMTCLDQVDPQRIPYSEQGKITFGDIATILKNLSPSIEKSYLSYSCCSDALELKK